MAPPDDGALLIPELLEELFHIISDMDDKGRTLKNCMLVCQTWLSLCYPFRHSRFVFKALLMREGEKPPPPRPPSPRLDPWGDPIEWIDEELYIPDRNFSDFLAFLTESPCLCFTIAELRLETRFQKRTGGFRCGNFSRGKVIKKIVGLEVEMLWRIIALLPNLRALDCVIHSLDFPEPALLSLPPAGLRLERLSIRHGQGLACTVTSEQHLSWFLQSFKTIRNLVLGRTLPSGWSPPWERPFEKVKVEQLTLRWNHSGAVRVSLDPAYLTVLDVSTAFYEDIRLPLDIFGPNLREIRFGPLSYQHNDKAYLDLSHCHKLTTLHFHFWIFTEIGEYGIPETGYDGWDYACRMFSEVPPGALRELKLVLLIRNATYVPNAPLAQELTTQLDRVDWSRLEPAVEKHPLLEHITIQLAMETHGGPPDMPYPASQKKLRLQAMTDYIKNRYSRHQQISGILQFGLASPFRQDTTW